MAEYDWGQDPGFVEDSSSNQRKVLWLALFCSAGGVAIALNHRMFGEPGIHWLACLLAALSGAAGVAIFSRNENLPIVAGLIPGLVGGASAYMFSAGYLSFRHNVWVPELFIPALIGSAPGILLYIIFVRLYHGLTE